MQNSLAYLKGESRAWIVLLSDRCHWLLVLVAHKICGEVSEVSHPDCTFIPPGVHTRSSRQPQPSSFSQPASWSVWQTPSPWIPPFPSAQQQSRSWNSSPLQSPITPLLPLPALLPMLLWGPELRHTRQWGTRFANNSPPSHSVLVHLIHTNSAVHTNWNHVLQKHFRGFYLRARYPEIFAQFRCLLL